VADFKLPEIPSRPPLRGLAVVGALLPSQPEETAMAKPITKSKTTPSKSTKIAASRSTPASAPRTKSATVLALLASKDGTTIPDIAAATGWQNHSVRGFLSGTVKRKLGRELSSVMVDGERRYRIAG
jgi:hypothetical protein